MEIAKERKHTYTLLEKSKERKHTYTLLEKSIYIIREVKSFSCWGIVYDF